MLLSAWFRPSASYSVGQDPWGLAAGDLNGDGVLDLVTANEDSNDLSLRLGLGNGQFGPPSRLLAGSGPSAVVAVDLNGNGRLDLAVTNRQDDTVSLLFGRGDGTFDAPIHLAVGDYPIALAAADLDGNGAIDLVTANFGGNSVSVLRNLGNGNFAPAVTQSVGRRPSGLAIAQINGVGPLDLAVTNRDDGTVSLLFGAGAGHWQPGGVINVPGLPWGIAAADLDGDGLTDLAVTSAEANSVVVLRGQGLGSFQAPVSYPVGHLPFAVVAVDGDGDGVLDLVVSNRGEKLDPSTDAIALLRGVGNGTFQAASFVAAGDGAYPIVAADFDNDGGMDLAVANLFSDDLTVLLNAIPSVRVEDLAVREGNAGVTSAVVTLRLSHDPGQPVFVDYTTEDGTAIAGQDYVRSSGRLTIHGTTATLTLSILGDTRVEGNETFGLRILSAAFADGTPVRVPSKPARITILDDDSRAPADFDRDGVTDLGVFRLSDAQWLARLSGGGMLVDPKTGSAPRFGAPNLMDIPLAGDFDGDGVTDLGVFRVATAEWLVRLSGGGVLLDPATKLTPLQGAPNGTDLPLTTPIGALAALGMGRGATTGSASRSVGPRPSVFSAEAPTILPPPSTTPSENAHASTRPEVPVWWAARLAWWRERLAARGLRR